MSNHSNGLAQAQHAVLQEIPAWAARPFVDPLYMPLAQAVADRFREGDINFKTALELLDRVPRG